jgi:16S rRNA (guanine527-N7)-methyltransferase
MNVDQQLIIGLKKLEIQTDSAIIHKFLQYMDLLQKWNHAYNLTTIKTPEKIISHHFLDSLSIYPYLNGDRFCDVGCGAGFPGIPLALILPHKQFVLIESLQKKVSFLIQVVYELGLKNVKVVHCRAEEYHPDICFDSVITRAFSSLKMMIETTEHLCCVDGKFLAMKGKVPTEELSELPPYIQVESINQLQIPTLNSERHLVILQKCTFKQSTENIEPC